MKTYKVNLWEKYYGFITVDAKNKVEARDKVSQMLVNEEVKPTIKDYEFDTMEIETL